MNCLYVVFLDFLEKKEKNYVGFSKKLNFQCKQILHITSKILYTIIVNIYKIYIKKIESDQYIK